MAATVVLRPITTHRQRLKSVLHQTVLDGRYHQTQLLLGMDAGTHPPVDVGSDSSYYGGVTTKINAVDLNGRTPLMVALLLDDRHMAEKFVLLLLEHGANTYVEDRFGQTPLHYACSFGLRRIADILMSHETFVPRNVVHPDMDGNTPLHILVEANDLGYLSKLLNIAKSREFDVDVINVIGLTPLLMAIRLGHYRAAYHLLRAGADPSIRDSEMKLNALDWILREDLKTQSQIPLAPIAGKRFQLIWKRTVRLKSQYERPITPICKHRSRFDNESIMNKDRAAAVSARNKDDANYKEHVVDMIDQFFGRCPVSLGSKQRTLLSMASACEIGGISQPPLQSQAPSSYRTPSGWPRTAKLRKLINRPEQTLPLWTLLDLYTTKSSPSFRNTVKPELHEFETPESRPISFAFSNHRQSIVQINNRQRIAAGSSSATSASSTEPTLQNSQTEQPEPVLRRTNSISDHGLGGRFRLSVGASSRLADHARSVGRMLSVVSAMSSTGAPVGTSVVAGNIQQPPGHGGAARLIASRLGMTN